MIYWSFSKRVFTPYIYIYIRSASVNAFHLLCEVQGEVPVV